MVSDLYLIAHIVRGEPAFDIATQIEIEAPPHMEGGDVVHGLVETMWIIPTSGHRAYPYWSIALAALNQWTGPAADDLASFDYECPETPPLDWPDHYPGRSDLTTKSKEKL